MTPQTAAERIAFHILTGIPVYLSPAQNAAVLAAIRKAQDEAAAVYEAQLRDLRTELAKAKLRGQPCLK